MAEEEKKNKETIQKYYDEVKLKKTQIINSSIKSLQAEYFEKLWNLIEEVPKLDNKDLFLKHRIFIKQALKRVSYDGFAIVFKKGSIPLIGEKGSSYSIMKNNKTKSAIVQYYESTGSITQQGTENLTTSQFILLKNDICDLKTTYADIDYKNSEDYAHIEIISNIDYSIFVNSVRSKGTLNVPNDPMHSMSADRIMAAVEDGVLFYDVDNNATTEKVFGNPIDAKSVIKSDQLVAANFTNADSSIKLAQTREDRLQKLFKQKGIPPASSKEGTFNAHNSEILLGWLKENRELFSKLKHIKPNIEELLSYLENKEIKFDFDLDKYRQDTIDILSMNNKDSQQQNTEDKNENNFSNFK